MATPDYSIVIPAYNEAELLPATLDSVRAAMKSVKGLVGEIIVVDNNSTDGTSAVALDRAARVVHEPHRQIARARNAGGRAAGGRYLIFVDADTFISPALLARTLTTLSSGKVCGGGARMVFAGKMGLSMRGMLWAWTAMSRALHWAAGAYVYCLREAFEGVGGFDERFYASEEIHFSQALKRWGRKKGQRVVILDEPAVTSMRKLAWFGPGRIVWSFLRLGLNPGRLRRRDGCRLWYDRPGRDRPSPP